MLQRLALSLLLLGCLAQACRAANEIRPMDYFGHRHVRDRDDEHHERFEFSLGLGTPGLRSYLYPNGAFIQDFGPMPDIGCTPRSRAYIYDRSYDPLSFGCRGYRNKLIGP